MIGSGIFPEKLAKLIMDTTLFIPRKIRNGEHLKTFHRYWCEELGEFKVKDSTFIGGTEYYFAVIYETDMQAVLTYPILQEAKCYELLKNFSHIEKESVINNRTRTFTGSEIKYWFCRNKIDFNDKENYNGFLKYLISENGILDSHKYMVRRNKKQNIFEFIDKTAE